MAMEIFDRIGWLANEVHHIVWIIVKWCVEDVWPGWRWCKSFLFAGGCVLFCDLVLVLITVMLHRSIRSVMDVSHFVTYNTLSWAGRLDGAKVTALLPSLLGCCGCRFCRQISGTCARGAFSWLSRWGILKAIIKHCTVGAQPCYNCALLRYELEGYHLGCLEIEVRLISHVLWAFNGAEAKLS